MASIGFRRNRGFSLVELSMVLAVTAVIAAIAVPVLSKSMQSMQLASDTKKIASGMNLAKLSATAQMTSYQVSFELARNEWSLLKKRSGTTSTYDLQQTVNQLSMGIANSGIAFQSTCPTGSAPSGFENLSSSTSIIFNSRGVPNGAAIVYLSKATTHYAVSVSIAGKVQVWRYRDNQWAPA